MTTAEGSLLSLRAKVKDGEVVVERSDRELVNLVLEQKNIVILKGVFDRERLMDLRGRLWEWSQARSPTEEYGGNGYRTREISGGAAAELYNRTWWFLEMPELAAGFRDLLLSFFEPMRNLQNRLAETSHTFERGADGMRLRPQIVQYPVGAGCFGSHVHPFLPQKIGLIAAMSEQGTDYHSGGTYFEIEGRSVDTAGHHQMGDLTIFRYDLVHGVSAVDPEEESDWTSTRGRWVMVLPYKDT